MQFGQLAGPRFEGQWTEREARPLFDFVAESRPRFDELLKLESELARAPDNLEVRMRIAGITAKYVSRRDAIRWYRNLLSIAPWHAAALQALAELERNVAGGPPQEGGRTTKRQRTRLN